jgi:hypothetical protein
MPEAQNVQIPLPLFRKIMSFFTCLSIGGYKFPALYDFDGIYADLRTKLDKINLRAAYTDMALAKNDKQKHQAYTAYQKLKNRRQP